MRTIINLVQWYIFGTLSIKCNTPEPFVCKVHWNNYCTDLHSEERCIACFYTPCMQQGNSKVDDNFVKLVCTEYLRRKMGDGASPADIKNIGTRIGVRLADDFFIKTDAKKARNVDELKPYLRQFFQIYFSYEPHIEGNKMQFDKGFILCDNASMLMVSGVIECIFAYIIDGGVRIQIAADGKYEVLARKDPEDSSSNQAGS